MELIRRDAVFFDVNDLGEQDIISNDSEISLVAQEILKEIVSPIGIGCVYIRRRKEHYPTKKVILQSVIELL